MPGFRDNEININGKKIEVNESNRLTFDDNTLAFSSEVSSGGSDVTSIYDLSDISGGPALDGQVLTWTPSLSAYIPQDQTGTGTSNELGTGTVDITANGSIIPSLDDTFTLGTSSNSWNGLYLSGSEISVDGGTLKVDGVEISGGSGSSLGIDGKVEYANLELTTDQTSVGSGEYIRFVKKNGDFNGWDDSTYKGTIPAGSLAILDASLYINGTNTGSRIEVEWYDITNGVTISSEGRLKGDARDPEDPAAGAISCTVIPETDIEVALRIDFSGDVDSIESTWTNGSIAVITPGNKYNEIGSGTVDITANESIIPSVSGAYDLGSLEKPWRSGYFTNNSLYLGEDKLSIEDGSLRLNDAQTFGGESNVKEIHTASNSSSLEFNVSSFTGVVEFLLEGIVPATDGADLTVEVSDDNGSTWESANYQWANIYTDSNSNPADVVYASSTSTGGTGFIRITGSAGSAAGEGIVGKVTLDDPSNSSLYKNIAYDCSYMLSGKNVRSIGGGNWEGATNAITNIRFLFDSGDIESGTIKMIDPTAAQTGSPDLLEDSEVRIPGKWWQDPNNTDDYYPMYRKVVDLGSLPDGDETRTAHGISNMHPDSAELRGTAGDGTFVFPLPFVKTNLIESQIGLYVDGADIVVDTGTQDRSSFTGYAVLKYAKTTDTPVTRAQAYGNGGGGATIVAPAVYTSDSGQSIANGTNQIVNFEDVEEDEDSLVTTGASWKWTAPKDMWVTVESNVVFEPATGFSAGDVLALALFVNGVVKRHIRYDEMDATENVTKSLGGSTKVKLNKDDYIDIRVYQDSGGSVALRSGSQFNWICITEYDTGIRGI